MSIESISASQQAAATVERQVIVMKKTRDVEKDVANALVDLVKQSGPGQVGSLINVVA